VREALGEKKNPEGLIYSGYGPSKGPAQPARNQFSGLSFCAWPLDKLCVPGFFIETHKNSYQLIIQIRFNVLVGMEVCCIARN
jgi:hypothetical protein